MKRSHFIKLSAMVCCSLLLAFQSCKKDDDTASPDNNNPGPNTSFTSASALLKSWAPETITVNIDASTGGSVDAENVHLYIKGGSVRLGSSPVTGTVSVSVTPISSKKDMMTSGVFTGAADGNMLESGGMFKISIRQGSNELNIDPAQPMMVKVDDPNGEFKDNMMLWNGGDSAAQDTRVRWVLEQGRKVNRDSVSSESYVFEWWNMGYCNIDRYVDMNNCSNDFKAVLPAGMDIAKTSIMIVFTDYHAEASTYYDNASSAFKTPYCLPLGKNIKVVCVTIKDKNLYYSMTDAVVSAGMTVNVGEGTLISETALETLLEGL